LLSSSSSLHSSIDGIAGSERADDDENVNEDSDDASADDGVMAGSGVSEGEWRVRVVEVEVDDTTDSERAGKAGEMDGVEETAAEADDGRLLLSTLEAGEELVDEDTKYEKAEEVDSLSDDGSAEGCMAMERPGCCFRCGDGCLAAFTLLPPCRRLMVACASLSPPSPPCLADSVSGSCPSMD